MTFPATAIAAERCGFLPCFVDVDPESWLLDPNVLLKHPRLNEAGLVIPVATFGIPVPQEPWLRFEKQTGIPVVIDGAACFDIVSRSPERFFGEIPVAISFHATKGFGVGEGGCIIWTEHDARRKCCEALNFGFYALRSSVRRSFNGKMSEYHAAVGMAALDQWASKRHCFVRVIERYREATAKYELAYHVVLHPRTDFVYPLLLCTDGDERLQAELALSARGIESRRWCNGGMLSHPHFKSCPHDDLSATASLADRLIGLPMACDLKLEECERVCETIAKIIIRSHLPSGRRAEARSN